MFLSLNSLITSLDDDTPQHTSIHHLRHPDPNAPPITIQTIYSTRTGFNALTTEGTVYTWGDPRFPHALGRPISRSSPANTPGIVDDLTGLKVVKVTTGGDVAAALTEGGDAFVWGMGALGGGAGGGFGMGDGGDDGDTMKDLLGQREDGEHIAKIVVPALGVESDGEDVEVVDVAVGDGHVIILDAEGRVWTYGANRYGQLGIGEREAVTVDQATAEQKPRWQHVDLFCARLKMGEGKRVKSVHAGDLTSFVLGENLEAAAD